MSLFTRIIDGELPGRFIWRDDTTVAWMDIRPLAPGHALIVPRTEIDRWTDLPVDVAAHCMTVAHHVANAQQDVWQPARVGLIIAGFEVPHVHVHVFPASGMAAFDFAKANTAPDAAALDADMHRLRAALRTRGHQRTVPSD